MRKLSIRLQKKFHN